VSLRRIFTEPIDKDLGLLVIRLGIGLSMFTFHGYGKLTGGPELWAGVGGGMQNLGITFLPALWGLLAALAESVGSILLMVGVLFRPAATLLAFTMIVAVLTHLNLPVDDPRAGWQGASHALELLAVYIGLLLAGPGRYGITLGTGRSTE
jgi:putative oxidoreductase